MKNIKGYAIIIGLFIAFLLLLCMYVYAVALYRKTFISGWLVFYFGLIVLGVTILIGGKVNNLFVKWIAIICLPIITVTAALYTNYTFAPGEPHHELIYIESKGLTTYKSSNSLGISINRDGLRKILVFDKEQKQLMDSAIMVEMEVYKGYLGLECIRSQTLVTPSEITVN